MGCTGNSRAGFTAGVGALASCLVATSALGCKTAKTQPTPALRAPETQPRVLSTVRPEARPTPPRFSRCSSRPGCSARRPPTTSSARAAAHRSRSRWRRPARGPPTRRWMVGCLRRRRARFWPRCASATRTSRMQGPPRRASIAIRTTATTGARRRTTRRLPRSRGRVPSFEPRTRGRARRRRGDERRWIRRGAPARQGMRCARVFEARPR
jgi:hypothetical protein